MIDGEPNCIITCLTCIVAVLGADIIYLRNQLDNMRDALANELAHDLRLELDSLKVSFANKEQELNTYSVLLSRLEPLSNLLD